MPHQGVKFPQEVEFVKTTALPAEFHSMTESKKTKAIEKSVDNDLLQNKVLQDIVEEQRYNLPELDIDEWNKVYDEIV